MGNSPPWRYERRVAFAFLLSCTPNSAPGALDDWRRYPVGDAAPADASTMDVVAADFPPQDGAESAAVTADGADVEPATDGFAIAALANDATGPAPEDAAPAVPRCDPAHAWRASLRIPSVTQAGFARFGGVGADELTIAWTSSDGTIYVADRSVRGSPFADPSAIDTTSTPVAADRVALDATGMVVFAVSADRTKFVAFSRGGAGAGWASSPPLQFVRIHAMASTEIGDQFFAPVLGADGRSFFFGLASSGGIPVLYESEWDVQADAWTTGVPLANPELSSTSVAGQTYATGASSDSLTLFFHDGVTGLERAAWRDSATSAFAHFTDISAIGEAAPNYRCDTLYYQGTDPADAGAFIAQ